MQTIDWEALAAWLHAHYTPDEAQGALERVWRRVRAGAVIVHPKAYAGQAAWRIRQSAMRKRTETLPGTLPTQRAADDPARVAEAHETLAALPAGLVAHGMGHTQDKGRVHRWRKAARASLSK